MAFKELFDKYNWEIVKKSIYDKTSGDVEKALYSDKRNLEDFKALISPAAEKYIEHIAQLSNKLTQKRFGKTIQLYIPLYVSNFCDNNCVYCGFNHNNKNVRKVLNKDEILSEVKILKDYGYEHILIVSGESASKAGTEYFEEVIKIIKPYFSLISFEVQALEQEEYQRLIKLGLNTVYIYQETYHKDNYPFYHPKGKKRDFYNRLEAPEKLGRAGIRRIGIGNLIGLEDWRTDAFFTALHLDYLEKTYWKTKYSISFPRLRPYEGQEFQPKFNISDKELVQAICAYRIFNEEVELSISVRESEKFRDNIIKLGITSMSAGSRTEPGGYSENLNNHNLKQFETHDKRTPKEIETMIKSQGYEAVWKDWDRGF